MLREEQSITQLRIPVKVQDDISIEAMPRRIFANAHTYHINSISVNSDDCTYLSADDLRVNLWDLERTDQSFSILIHMTYSLIHRQQALGMRLHSSLLMCCLSNTISLEITSFTFPYLANLWFTACEYVYLLLLWF